MISLRLRLLAALAVAIVTGTAWLVWTQAQAMRPRAWQAMEESLVDTAQILAATVAAGSPGDTPAPGIIASAWATARNHPVQAKIYDRMKDTLALECTVTDRRGVVIFASADPTLVGRDHSQWNDVARTLQGRYGARATPSDPGNPSTSVLHVAAPILREGTLIGVLSVAKPVDAVATFTAEAQTELVRAGIVAAGAMAALAILIGHWITRPLARLTAHVRRAATGQREDLPPLGRGEIAELGEALQRLRRELDGRSYIEGYVQSLTHELKSPLAGIRASAELLGEDLPPADRAKFLAHVLGECGRLTDLVERLLNLSALERKEALENPVSVSMTELTTDICARLAPRAKTVELVVSGTGFHVSGDPFLLGQALENLVVNALAVAPEGSTVEIHLRPDGVAVRDHGPGIPAWAIPRLGTRFFTFTHPGSTRRGTGLGLAFVREVMRLHGGSLTLGNHPEGGAEAVLMLRPTDVFPGSAGLHAGSAGGHAGSGRPTHS